MKKSSSSRPPVNITIRTNRLPLYLPLLGSGILETTVAGTTIESCLTAGLAIPPGYITNRIQTIFLNGKPVDDLQRSILQQGDTLALSAAMPGLVGATFRRSGFYAKLRQQISHNPQATGTSAASITFTLKLFNLIAAELGPALFSRGVTLKGKTYHDFLTSQEEHFFDSLMDYRIDGKKPAATALLCREQLGDYLRLIITSEK